MPHEAAAPAHHDRPSLRLLDLFEWRGRGPHLVWLDAGANLHVTPRDAKGVPLPVRKALATREVLGPLRELDAKWLWVMRLDRVVDGPDLPGPDDPLHLEGALAGPFPEPSVLRAEGSLATTRLELLDALVRGGPDALGCGRGGAAWSHALVAGGSEAEAGRGEDLVLLFPGLTASGGTGNGRTACKLFFELLSGVQRDLERGKVTGPWSKKVLPVPSRLALEGELEALGYAVKRHWATRARGGLLGLFLREALKLPPEGSLSDFQHLARAFLDATPGWPGERVVALRRRTRPAVVGWNGRHHAGLWPVAVEGLAAIPTGEALSLYGSKKRTQTRAFFRADEGFVARAASALEVQLDFEDGKGELSIGAVGKYDRLVESERLELGDSLAWRQATLRLEGTVPGHQLKAGATLSVIYRGEGSLRLRGLKVSAAEARPPRGFTKAARG